MLQGAALAAVLAAMAFAQLAFYLALPLALLVLWLPGWRRKAAQPGNAEPSAPAHHELTQTLA
ncbi:methyl-accepting chemotaxis protein, partial [Pseudomonas shirazensis]